MSWQHLETGDRIRIENRTPARFLEARFYAATVMGNVDGVISIMREDDVFSAETGDQLNGHDRIVELIRKAPEVPSTPPKQKPRQKKDWPPDGKP